MVSIVLPVYQVEDYIEKCIETLLAQTYEDIEVICVNDCTMDNSITVLKEYQKRDPRIRLVHHEENRGLGGARNTGIDCARGEYIVFVDSDDYVSEKMVEKLYRSITDTGSDAAVCGVMQDLPDKGLLRQHTAFIYEEAAGQKTYRLETEKDRRILADMWPSACNKLFKMSIIRENHIRFQERMLYEDHTFYYEYFGCCRTFSYIQEPLYYYRIKRPGSITTGSVGREAEIFAVLDCLRGIFKKLYGRGAREMFVKIAVRLLYERRWVFDERDPGYYQYLLSAHQYLNRWPRAYLWDVKDSFIGKSDPVFWEPWMIRLIGRINTEHRILRRLLRVCRAAVRYAGRAEVFRAAARYAGHAAVFRTSVRNARHAAERDGSV